LSKIHSFILEKQLSNEKMLVEEYIQMDGKDLIGEELTNTKLVDVALEIIEASPSNLDLNVDSILNGDNQPPPIVKLIVVQHHASILSHFC
jgi:hypothetical protein